MQVSGNAPRTACTIACCAEFCTDIFLSFKNARVRNERLNVSFWRLVDFGVNSLGNLAILRICSCLARDRYCNTIFTTWFIEIFF